MEEGEKIGSQKVTHLFLEELLNTLGSSIHHSERLIHCPKIPFCVTSDGVFVRLDVECHFHDVLVCFGLVQLLQLHQ